MADPPDAIPTPPDPLGVDEPHDVLAAEEFAIPAQEPGIPHDPDPEPHDVLAAEEFAFPAGVEPHGGGRGGASGRGLLLLLVAGALAALALRRRHG